MCCLQVKEVSTYLEEEHLICIPSVLTNLATIPLAEFMAPVSDGFVADGNTSCCQQFFDVTEAKYKSMIKPLSATDNLELLAISGINIRLSTSRGCRTGWRQTKYCI
jgi:hypothetical protein